VTAKVRTIDEVPQSMVYDRGGTSFRGGVRCRAAVAKRKWSAGWCYYVQCQHGALVPEPFCATHDRVDWHKRRDARRAEHAQWAKTGLRLAAELRRREIDRLHERALEQGL